MLEAEGVASNTLTFFTSDNGPFLERGAEVSVRAGASESVVRVCACVREPASQLCACVPACMSQ